MPASPPPLSMRDGTPFELHPCVEPGSPFTPQHLREALQRAVGEMSAHSLWQRFAAPVRRLSDRQLDVLTDLDGSDRVAWCAIMTGPDGPHGIGIARYVRLVDRADTAEFAVTVLDAFQGQGVGRALLERLIRTARDNRIATLRGYLTPGNRRVLGLCRYFNAKVTDDGGMLRAEIPTAAE